MSAGDPLNMTKAVKVDLIEDGVLWYLNKAALHGRGFALMRQEDGSLYLVGDGTEPIQFEPELEEDKFLAFEALLDRARENNA